MKKIAIILILVTVLAVVVVGCGLVGQGYRGVGNNTSTTGKKTTACHMAYDPPECVYGAGYPACPNGCADIVTK